MSVVKFSRHIFCVLQCMCMFVTHVLFNICTKSHLLTVPCLIPMLHALVSAFVKTHKETNYILKDYI